MEDSRPPRHALLVRITHWINAGVFIAFILSGLAILLAYPRLHWGETGYLEAPSLIDLPLPFVLGLGIRGPGRYVHFLTAWIFLFNGLIYLVWGLRNQHFKREFIPRRSDLKLSVMAKIIVGHLRLRDDGKDGPDKYNVLQRSSYLVVVFLLLPFMFISGLAMSPTVTSVLPFLVDMLGGQQSARTLHFFSTCLLLSFFLVHLALVIVTGFRRRMKAMITG